MKVKQQNIIQWGLLLPIITVNLLGAVYYREIGFFDTFHIPLEYIQVEVTSAIRFAAFFLAELIPVSFIIVFYLYSVNDIQDKKQEKILKWTARSLLFVFYIIISIIFPYGEILFLMWAFMLATFISQHISVSNAPLLDFGLTLIRRYPLQLFIPVVQIFCLICIISFFVGRQSAENTIGTYGVKKGTNFFILRKYSSYSIFGVLDSNKSITPNEFLIEYSPNETDTIQLKSQLEDREDCIPPIGL